MIYIFVSGFFLNLGILTSIIFTFIFSEYKLNKDDIMILLIAGFNSLGFGLSISIFI